MIEVRIRYDSMDTAVHLCTWPATELDQLIPTITRWGGPDIGDDNLTGNFVIDDDAAYFEVILDA